MGKTICSSSLGQFTYSKGSLSGPQHGEWDKCHWERKWCRSFHYCLSIVTVTLVGSCFNWRRSPGEGYGQCKRDKRLSFDPWVGKIPWRRAWQPTPVILPGESQWTEEPGRLQSMGSQRIRHDRATKHACKHCGT